jgi:hypothetical protein
MCMNAWTLFKESPTFFKDSATLIIATGAACVGLWTYAKNAKTRRAEFMVDLHKSFFVEEKYKHIREVLDSDEEKDVEERKCWVSKEPEEFIEFLNFFELVAYLRQNKNLSIKDVKALFSYYLNLLNKHHEIRMYVDKDKNSFEHLKKLLAKIK